MNALFLKDLADKTRRGLRGRVEAGKSGGGLCYGYDVVKRMNAAGEPIYGERRINEAEAAIVRRIFTEFAAGISPRRIAVALNNDGVPGPLGRAWGDTTIRGHVCRGTGIVNNELYVGRLIWNRLRYIKDPSTGRRVSRINPTSEWITTEVPELRIIDDELWQAVRARQADISKVFEPTTRAVRAARAKRLHETRRPAFLLSGLLTCGTCSGRYGIILQDRYGCLNHHRRGTCDNNRTIRRPVIEQRALVGSQGEARFARGRRGGGARLPRGDEPPEPRAARTDQRGSASPCQDRARDREHDRRDRGRHVPAGDEGAHGRAREARRPRSLRASKAASLGRSTSIPTSRRSIDARLHV